MHEWNATTITMAKPRRLLRATLDLVMLPDRYRISSYRQSGPRYRAAWRASEGPAAFSHRGHYALIRPPYNACLPGAEWKLAFNRSKSGADRGVHGSRLRSGGAWAAIDITDERPGRDSAVGPAPCEKVAHSRAGAAGDGSPPAQAYRIPCPAPAGGHANDRDRSRRGQRRSRCRAPSAQRPLRSLFPRRRLRARHREAGAGFHLAHRRRRARPRALLRLSARPRTSVPGGARGRGRRLSLARRPVRSPADRLHGGFGGRRARARNALQAAR